MTTFDQILPKVTKVLHESRALTDSLDWLLINRDLNGRVRLIAPEALETDSAVRASLSELAKKLADELAPHVYPESSLVLFDVSREQVCKGAVSYILGDFKNVWVVDRHATEADWTRIAPETQNAPRIVFFSIKGGVGRSTALAATAWSLAQAGKRVLVLDLDLESPGLSLALLPSERQPMYGITDWLVEDLVDNAGTIFDSMVATSALSHDGEIYVVPAHGSSPGEYISKLGRVWMPKLLPDGSRESWSVRLNRLLLALEERIQPDVILIDSRSGIDEIASACITDMGANLILLFSLEGGQTWNGYRLLFEQWQRALVAEKIRERLKVVGAIVPELDRQNYVEGLREHAYDVFVDTLYDEIAPVDPDMVGLELGNEKKWRVGGLVEGWNFDEADEGAPHYPWTVNWHRSFAGLRSLQGRLSVIDAQEVDHIFGPLLSGISDIVDVWRRA